MRPGSLDFLYLAVLVICAGCRVPYNVVDVRGPVRTVRVLDADLDRRLQKPGGTPSIASTTIRPVSSTRGAGASKSTLSWTSRSILVIMIEVGRSASRMAIYGYKA